MKILPLLLFIFSIFLVSCSEKTVKSDLKTHYLIGNVKSCRVYHYKVLIRLGAIQKGSLENVSTDSFDKLGNIVESYSGFYKEREYKKFIYKNDKTGNVVGKTCYTLKGEFIDSFIYEYNRKGDIVAECNYNKDGSLFSNSVYQNDSNGNHTLSKTYRKGNIIDSQVAKYNIRSKLIEEDIWDFVENNFKKIEFLYDDNNFIVEQKEYIADGSLISKHNYKIISFDKLGNPLTIQFFHNDTPSTIVENELLFY